MPQCEWLDGWTPVEAPPATAAELRSDIARLAEVLRPAQDDEIIVLLEPLERLFGPRKPGTTAIYLMALTEAELPAIAIAMAVRSCLAQCHFYPLPAEILEQVPTEFEACRQQRRRLGTALIIAEREDRRARQGPVRPGAREEMGRLIDMAAKRMQPPPPNAMLGKYASAEDRHRGVLSRFVQATGRDLGAFWTVVMSDDEAAKRRLLDELEQQMIADGWTDPEGAA